MGQESLFNVEKPSLLPRAEKVFIYHDEIKDDKNNPIAHGFLIIPKRSLQVFFDDLIFLKKKFGISRSQLHWQRFGGRTFSLEEKCAKRWFRCFSVGLADKRYLSCSSKSLYNKALGIRFCAFFMDSIDELDNEYWDWCSSEGEKTIKKFETLLRIGFKGGLHFLYDEEYCVEVLGFYTDAGAFHRELDNKRIIGRLRSEINPYISFSDNLKIISCNSDHKLAETIECESYRNAHFLQLCDIVLGGISFTCLKGRHRIKRVITRRTKRSY